MRSWTLAVVAAVACALATTAPLRPAEAQDHVQVDPAAEEAFFRGVGLLEAGQAEAAVAEFDAALSLQPDFRRVYYYRSRALLALEDHDGARQSAELYAKFELNEAERKQLEGLLAEIDKTSFQPEPLEPPPPDVTPDSEPDPGPDPGEAAARLIAEGREQLAEGLCHQAIEAAQEALQIDPSATGALLIKGLGLECLGELERARALILTYVELQSGGEPDPAAAEAVARIEAELARQVAEAAAAAEPQSTDDPLIQGVFDDRWGDQPSGRLRIREVAGIGKADARRGRIKLADSKADAEMTRVWGDEGLDFSRVRVWGRSGSDSASWFASAFHEQYLSIEAMSGEPTSTVGLPTGDKPHEGAGAALGGRKRWEATWEDADGDLLVLRLGRCSAPGQKHRILAENQPCLELAGARGAWAPPPEEASSMEALAVRLAETPGRLSWDLALDIGAGFAPLGITVLDDGSAAYVGEFGVDLLGTFSVGAFVAGIGWTPSLSVQSTSPTDTLTGFGSRVSFYVGARDTPRQPRSRSFLLGIGMLPDEDYVGNKTVAPAISIRIQEQMRVSPIGRFWFAFEPYVAFGVGAVQIVPLRFSIGGGFSTKSRLAGGRQPDPPRFQ
jgi:tetratricopeptide (TPR) repeat protein